MTPQRLCSTTADSSGLGRRPPSLFCGTQVLDVGCGTSDDAHTLASLIGATGCVVGIDARQRSMWRKNGRETALIAARTVRANGPTAIAYEQTVAISMAGMATSGETPLRALLCER
jgi:cyclopropane fatty-acyl-phospholipid synthase-like methyltransferase